MRVRRLSIKNFRGIKNAEWEINSNFVALIGPGDSTKTTLLDALGLVLSDRYNISFTDSDFYNSDISQKLEIEAVIVDLPDSLVDERSHGLNRSGIDSNGVLHHDPADDGVVECLILRLQVDSSLEPSWQVIRPNEPVGTSITASERGKIGFFRLGENSDLNLRWSRNSALSAMTNAKSDVKNAVIEAQRKARDSISKLEGTPLHDVTELVRINALKFGSGPFENLRPGLDPQLGGASSALLLHNERVPLTQFGLGTKRLLSLSIQETAVLGNSIVGIDEIEQGLDPHRLLHLIRYLQKKTKASELQVFLTTHSPQVIEALEYSQVGVVRSAQGVTQVTSIPSELASQTRQSPTGLIRALPAPLLARKILVGEGATEAGFIRGLLAAWDEELDVESDFSSITVGVGICNGGGSSSAPIRAAAMAELGYPVLILIDGDVNDNADHLEDSRSKGVSIIQWSDGKAFEDIVIDALPCCALQDLIDLAESEIPIESIIATVNNHLGDGSLLGNSVASWLTVVGESDLRRAIASASQGKKVNGETESKRAWFKREDFGESLANLCLKYDGEITNAEYKQALESIKKFAYEVPLNVQDEPVATEGG